MKKAIASIALSLLVSFSLINLAGATSYIPACDTSNSTSGTASNTAVCQDVQTQANSGGNIVIRLISDAINVLSFLVGGVALIIIIVSGIRLVVSSGESNAVASAKSGIIAAIIGIVIVVLAQTIVILVLDNIK